MWYRGPCKVCCWFHCALTLNILFHIILPFARIRHSWRILCWRSCIWLFVILGLYKDYIIAIRPLASGTVAALQGFGEDCTDLLVFSGRHGSHVLREMNRVQNCETWSHIMKKDGFMYVRANGLRIIIIVNNNDTESDGRDHDWAVTPWHPRRESGSLRQVIVELINSWPVIRRTWCVLVYENAERWRHEPSGFLVAMCERHAIIRLNIFVVFLNLCRRMSGGSLLKQTVNAFFQNSSHSSPYGMCFMWPSDWMSVTKPGSIITNYCRY